MDRDLKTIAPLRTALAFLCVLAAAACGDSAGPDFGPPAALTVISGNLQSGTVGALLAEPVVVKVADASGRLVVGTTVSFSVTGGGSVNPATATTDAEGVAKTVWTLGTNVVGQQALHAQAGTFTTGVIATASAGPAIGIAKVGGDAQSGTGNAVLPTVLTVMVTDQYGNAVEGASVQWQAIAGGGLVLPGEDLTDANGRSDAGWLLGTAGDQVATASLNESTKVTFTANVTNVQ